MINTGQRLNIAADSIYLWSIAKYVIDPEICSADSAYEALIDSIPGTPTHWRLSFFFFPSSVWDQWTSVVSSLPVSLTQQHKNVVLELISPELLRKERICWKL